MSVYLTEEEQLALIRQLWDKYGTYVLATLVLVLAVIFGMRWWESSHRAVKLQASSVYQQLLVGVDKSSVQTISTSANALIEQYPETVYSHYARMYLAKIAADAGQYDKALSFFREIIDGLSDPALVAITRLRAARVLAAQGKYSDALDILAPISLKPYQSAKALARGDIYVAMKDYKRARDAYQIALRDLAVSAATERSLIQMKLYNLPAVNKKQVAHRRKGVKV